MTEPTNEAPPEKMLGKIRALLAKAEDDAATKEESETFMAKATELMAKYGVTCALLAAAQPTATATATAADKIFTVEAPYADHKSLFLYHVANAMGCKGIHLGRGPNSTARIHLFGMDSDLERVEILFTSLLLQLARFIVKDFDSDPRSRTNPRKWRADYIRGFTVTVVDRITKSETAAKAQAQAEAPTGTSVALVLVKRGEMVTKALAARYPSTRKRTGRVAVGSGYGQGQAAGHRADLGATSLDGRSRAAISG